MGFLEKNHILFDLDGTLTDPAEGITRSVQHALAGFGLNASREELLCFIGPPLADSFVKYFGFTEEASLRAVSVYREYFAEKGIFENRVYPGIPELLKRLRSQGKQLYLATSKPEVFARRILAHFQLDKYFTFAGGSCLDGTRVRKGEVIRYVLEQAGIPPGDAVMVGDREHDALGASEVGIPCAGVLYGYGDRSELERAGAAAIAEDLAALEKILIN
jgi:phosphoglycolate phosphatase